MENSFQTSFIPKKPIVANGAVSGGAKNSSNIFVVVSILIFVITGLLAGGLFFYKDYLLKDKEKLSSNLFKIRDSFDKDTIAELEFYDKRVSVAKQVLSNHIVLSPLFDLVNKLTLSSIQYTKFEHRSNNNVFSVNMSGIARDYKSIALQADVFNTNEGRMFKDVIFSNITKDKNNYVTFNVEFNVDPKLLSYGNSITNKEVEESKTPNIASQNIVETKTSSDVDIAEPLQDTKNIQ